MAAATCVHDGVVLVDGVWHAAAKPMYTVIVLCGCCCFMPQFVAETNNDGSPS